MVGAFLFVVAIRVRGRNGDIVDVELDAGGGRVFESGTIILLYELASDCGGVALADGLDCDVDDSECMVSERGPPFIADAGAVIMVREILVR